MVLHSAPEMSRGQGHVLRVQGPCLDMTGKNQVVSHHLGAVKWIDVSFQESQVHRST